MFAELKGLFVKPCIMAVGLKVFLQCWLPSISRVAAEPQIQEPESGHFGVKGQPRLWAPSSAPTQVGAWIQIVERLLLVLTGWFMGWHCGRRLLSQEVPFRRFRSRVRRGRSRSPAPRPRRHDGLRDWEPEVEMSPPIRLRARGRLPVRFGGVLLLSLVAQAAPFKIKDEFGKAAWELGVMPSSVDG